MTSVARTDPPRRPKRGAKNESPSSAAAPGSDTGFDASADTQLADEDATQGEWLFKQDDMVLGPVSAIVLVDKIKKGELSSDTPIARDGQPFRPMKLLPLFRDAWMAREEERRLALEEKAHQGAVARARFLRVVVVLVLFVAPFAAAAAGARALMVARPWDHTAEWIARVPPLVDLPQKPPEVKRDPSVGDGRNPVVADNSVDDEDEDDDPKVPRDPKKPRIKKPKKDPKDTSADRSRADPVADGKKEPAAGGAVPESLTNSEAIAPLKGAQGAMKACFKAEMEANPEMPAQVVLSYTITEEGKAININLDARELRGRPVIACVQGAISGLKWPRFSGERKNVSVPFKLGKPPAPKP
ncbi:MAG: AgmX/PglI C-terminal domain-containing protein [Deltaproteobacteria bacterium]|nr:AgmX/PglI C-terminal domain-containing protein [Deltaproteobacteria bacterium]